MNSEKLSRQRSSASTGRRKKRSRQEPGQQYQHFEDVLELINPFGAFQIFVCICIIFAQIEWAGNFSFINVMGSVEPSFECTPVNKPYFGDAPIQIEPPMDARKCAYLRDNCTAFTPVKNSTEFNSIVATFKLICDNENVPETIQILQALALMIGSIVGGHLGDHFGRQCIFYMSQLGIVITSCLTTASTSWVGYAFCQCLNGFLYGIIEVETITLVVEYTSNRYRMIPVACFQWNVANMVIALIAYLTRDWQKFFVVLNMITSPIIMAFMLFNESPRWLIARGKFRKAANVLNDLTDKRWNGTEVVFTAQSLEAIPHETTDTFYNFSHLFVGERFAKQSLMQMMAVFTYSLVAMAYFYVIRDFTGSSITIVFLDGLFRLFIPILIICLDMCFEKFTRRFQFLLSLSLMAICFVNVVILVGFFGHHYTDHIVTMLVIVGGMINDSVFWMNIVQVTTQRYPTVIRCIAFGCLHSVKHVGTIVGILFMQPLLRSAFTVWIFVLPTVLIAITLFVGIFLQPDTKGKALLDTMDELDYTRMESALPKALYRMAVMHRLMQSELHNKIADENRERWAQWREELESREKAPIPTAEYRDELDENVKPSGRSNLAFEYSPERDNYSAMNDESIARARRNLGGAAEKSPTPTPSRRIAFLTGDEPRSDFDAFDDTRL